MVATGLAFPEGPIAMPDGSVIVVEIAGARLTRVLPGGSVQVIAELGGGPKRRGARPRRALLRVQQRRLRLAQDAGFTRPTAQPPATAAARSNA